MSCSKKSLFEALRCENSKLYNNAVNHAVYAATKYGNEKYTELIADVLVKIYE